MTKCATCSHWSEMIAKMESGTTVSMCLNPESPKNGEYTAKWMGCDQHDDGMPRDLDRVPAGQRQRSVDHRQKLREES